MKTILAALSLITVFAAYAQTTPEIKEDFMLDWPDSEHWKVGSVQESGQVKLIELIHEDETLDKWTEFGNMMSLKGVTIPVEKAMNAMYDQSLKNAPDATLTLFEKDEKAEYPWIIFKIESPRFNNDPKPESQLWYIVQGKGGLYTNFRAVKEKKISKAQEEKWIAFFKTGKVVAQ